ncbi:MAG: dimethyl sulfoxide reductase anchor subunit [Chromatiales bacterium]|jgi:DMSO reductase iron-sulfur subunit
MFQARPGEQKYAWLPDSKHPQQNRYGQNIETVPDGHEMRGQSLNINGDNTVSDNPNRYKQHGFYFTADNCIGCHACEAACSEKNNLPPYLAFRSVGYLEGGNFPAYQRMNISMACNHCDNPVCLKGCPTRAYTKFAEYGAVLQDPDICFGCGYCTWVCPYNAPQLDTKAGHVSKCNMCVDRLEAGLKPACAAACLGGALDFGIVESKPENRDQLQAQIPGFPTPEITHPNVRFQQVRSMPKKMSRTDSMPIRYERDEQMQNAGYTARLDADGRPRQWGLKKLSTRENPLVVFTLITQAMVGALLLLFFADDLGLALIRPDTHPIAWPLTLFSMIGLQTFALVLSTLHLGRPHRFYRAFNNLRYSPVSREVAGVALFYNFLGAYALLTGLPALVDWLPPAWLSVLVSVAGWGAAISGIAALYFMHRIYRIPARPFWNHWQVLSSFYGNMLVLGALFVGLISNWLGSDRLWDSLALLVITGLLLEGIGLWFHARDLRRGSGEAQAAFYLQTTDFGNSYWLRNAGLLLGFILTGVLLFSPLTGQAAAISWSLLAALLVTAAVIGRALFYALVIPTTMPGAFFWRNAGFVEHARETGLDAMPQFGIMPEH